MGEKMRTKYCPKCKQTLPMNMFHKNKSRGDGHQGLCKKCTETRSHEKYKNFIPIMHELKSNGCAICGYNECDASLDFHHVNPQDKKFNLMMSGLNHTNEKIAKN